MYCKLVYYKLIEKIEKTDSFKRLKKINPTIVAGYDIMCLFIKHLNVNKLMFRRVLVKVMKKT